MEANGLCRCGAEYPWPSQECHYRHVNRPCPPTAEVRRVLLAWTVEDEVRAALGSTPMSRDERIDIYLDEARTGIRPGGRTIKAVWRR